MDFIKAQLDRIQQQLAGLNASQKMLTAALVAIMLITVVWWGKYAGEAEMVPLVGEPLTTEQIGRIQQVLGDKGIETQTSGDKLMIRSEKRMAALGALTIARAMPRITDDGFKQMLSQMNPFDSVEKGDKIWNHQKQDFLSDVIGGIKGVVKADVIIDPTSNRRIDGNIDPSASVSITLEDGVGEKQKLVDAAAALLAGSQAGLSYNRITVVVNGVVQRVHDPEHDEMGSSADQLEYREKEEAYQEEKVRQGYYFITGLAVKVSVSLNTTSVLTDKKEYDGKGAVSKAIKSTEETDETTGGAAQGGGEAGAVPNIGLPAAPQATASAGPSQNHSKTEEQFQVLVPETHITSKTPAGTPTTLGATVQIPYSYFVHEFKHRNSGAKEPTEKDLEPLITAEQNNMRQAVANLLALASVDKVSINTYPDVADDLGVQPVTAASGMAGVSLLVGAHAKEIALGTLAVMSLFMATMMVRKSAPATVPAMPAGAIHAPPAAPAVLPSEALAGEASSGGAMLDGMELNEETIKAQQMVEQVSTLVRENPDAAASLVKRWLNRN